jgi:hypothetical protein
MRHYNISGLIVASDLDLPIAAVPECKVPDVFIRRAAVPTKLPDAKETGPTWQVAEGRILLLIPGVARFLMTEGDELAFEPEAGRSDEDLKIFLLGSAFGALLHQRGGFVLHASAVAVNGEAVLFCGASGSGKSSLVAALSAAGYPVLADDVGLIQTASSGRPMVAPDGRRLKLWADAMSSLSISSKFDAAVRPGILKFWVDPQTTASPEALPLRAVYFLRAEAPPHRSGIEPLSSLVVLALLRQNAYRPRLVKLLGQEADWLERSLSVIHASDAFHLTRRWSFDALPGCIEALQRHWETGKCAPTL